MGWWSNAWDNVSSAASSAVSAVGDAADAVGGAIADVTVYATAEVLNAGTSLVNGATNLVGAGDVVDNFDFVDKKIDARNEFIDSAVKTTVSLAISAKDVVVDRAISIKDGAVAAYDWTIETGAPAVGKGLAWAAAVNPIPPFGYIARGMESLGFGDPLGIAAKHRKVGDAVYNFGEFVASDPKRALALAGQGIVNGVTSTVGFFGDGARMIVTGAGDVVRNVGSATYDIGRNVVSGAYDIGRNVVSGTYDLGRAAALNTINAAYSIGQKPGDAPLIEVGDVFQTTKAWNDANGNGGFFSTTKSWNGDSAFFRWTGAANEYSGGAFGYSTWMNDKTQMIERIESEYLEDHRETILDASGNEIANPMYMKKRDIEDFKVGEDEYDIPAGVNIVENKNANYERVLLYGGQAVFEVPAFVLTTVGTGGLGTAAWVARYGGKVAQTAATLKRVDMVADALRLTAKADKLLKPRTILRIPVPRLASETALKAKSARLLANADELANGARYASRGDAWVDATRRLILNGKDKVLHQSDLMEYLSKHADNLRDAETALAKLKGTAGASERQIANLTRKVDKAKGVLDEKLADVNKLTASTGNGLSTISDDVARTATRTTNTMNSGQRAWEGFKIGSHRGFRIADPWRNPIIDGVGVSASFGVGVWADQKNAAAEQAASLEISEGAARDIVSESTDRMKAAGEDTSWYNSSDSDENTTPDNNEGNQPGALKTDFQENQPNQNGSSDDPLPGGETVKYQQSGVFNNRANGIVIPLDQPLFEVTVSEEAANNFRRAIRQT